MGQTKKAKSQTIKRGRDSGTGRFVPTSYAKAHPETTEIETIQLKKK